jgi:hypothetical protein
LGLFISKLGCDDLVDRVQCDVGHDVNYAKPGVDADVTNQIQPTVRGVEETPYIGLKGLGLVNQGENASIVEPVAVAISQTGFGLTFEPGQDGLVAALRDIDDAFEVTG